MLTKLLQYEGKTTARVLLPIGGGVAVFSLMTGIMNFLLDRPNMPNLVDGLRGLVVVAAVLALMFSVAACIFVNIQRFYKLLGEQGYLMFSLPVPVWQHIAAKLICAVLWGVACVPYLILCSSLMSLDFSWVSVIGELFQIDLSQVPTVLLVLLMLLAAAACGFLHIYLCCVVGGQFGQQRLLATIISYFVLGFVEQMAGTVLMVLLVNTAAESYTLMTWSQAFFRDGTGFMNMVLVIILALLVLFSALLWAIVQWFMTRHLNLA